MRPQSMYTIINKEKLGAEITQLDIQVPLIAKRCAPGQFVVVVVDEKSERIPLTIADWDKDEGSIRIIFQELGASTQRLARLSKGDKLYAVLGPLGITTHLEKIGTVICVGGGVGIAEIFPVVRGFKQKSNKLFTIIGARNKDLLILEDELKRYCDELLITTDDGSKGEKGFVIDVLKKIFDKEKGISKKNCLVYAVGPVAMMKAVADLTRGRGIKTLVSLNPIMLDATGMCGACRVSIKGQTRFACVDGPEFNAHEVDFNQLEQRLNQHKHLEDECKINKS